MSAERRVFAIHNRNRSAPLHPIQFCPRPPILCERLGRTSPLFQRDVNENGTTLRPRTGGGRTQKERQWQSTA